MDIPTPTTHIHIVSLARDLPMLVFTRTLFQHVTYAEPEADPKADPQMLYYGFPYSYYIYPYMMGK